MKASSSSPSQHDRTTNANPPRVPVSEKTGIARVQEALESNDWAHADPQDVSDFGDSHDGHDSGHEHLDPEKLDFGIDATDIEGLKRAIWGADAHHGTDADDTARSRAAGGSSSTAAVQHDDRGTPPDELGESQQDKEMSKMEDMMRKLQAVREAGEGLPEAQRRRMAARAVQEVMREL